MTTPRLLPDWDTTAEHRGEWWPPERPELRYPGVLRVIKRNPTLTIEAPPIGQEVFELGGSETLHGKLETGQAVTLWDLQQHHLVDEHALNGDTFVRYHRTFTYAILGRHHDGYDRAVFRYSAVGFHGLDTWSMFPQPILRGTPHPDLPQHRPAVLVGPYADMFKTKYAVTVRIEHPMRAETDDRFPAGAIMNHPGEHVRIVFQCEPPAPAGFHDLLLRDAQSLLTFCYQAGAPVLGEWMATDDPAQLLPVIRPDSFRGRNPIKQSWLQMILTTRDMDAADLLAAWWLAVEELFPAPQVVTMYQHSSRGVLEQSTASAIAAAENMHEKIGPTLTRFEGGYLDARLKELIKSYSGDDSKEFRQFLREKFKEDRPVLSTRLTELLAAVTPERVKKLGLNSAGWVKDVKEVRNKLAHTGAHVLRRGDTGKQLDRVNIETRALLTMLILGCIGADGSALDRAAGVLANNMKFSSN